MYFLSLPKSHEADSQARINEEKASPSNLVPNMHAETALLQAIRIYINLRGHASVLKTAKEFTNDEGNVNLFFSLCQLRCSSVRLVGRTLL